MRPDVKLGVVISMVLVFVAGSYFLLRDSGEKSIPIAADVGSASKHAAVDQPPGAKRRAKESNRQGSAAEQPGTTPRRDRSDSRRADRGSRRPLPRVAPGRRSADGTPLTTGGRPAARDVSDERRTAAAKRPVSVVDSSQIPHTTSDTLARLDRGATEPGAGARRRLPGAAGQHTPLAATRPSTTGTVARRVTTTRAAAVETHRVQPGDTLSSLALRYYGSAVFTRHLIENNLHIADPDRLTIGMVVKIPPAPAGVARRAAPPSKTAEARGPRTYTTKAGDSFYAIARDVLGDARRWKELLELNAHVVGGDPTRLQVGQVLVLPNR